jgi:hypothetical protein
MINTKLEGGCGSPRNSKNTARLGAWTAAWLVTLALGTFGPISIWDYNKVMSIVAIVLNLGVGLGMILANKRHLQGLDELHQKIQLEAMAIALGVGLVFGLSYSVLDIANVIAFDAEIAFLVILVSLTYGAAVFAGIRRYQ